MKSLIEKAHGLAASSRLPNLPSVISNVLLGILLACFLQDDTGPELRRSLWVIASACSLYLAGNLLNDLSDREWDRQHRPERALPSGLFRPAHYAALACVLTTISWTTAALASLQALAHALAISASILIYTRSHKRSAWSVVPMALCRALLPLMGYAAVTGSWKIPATLGLAATALGCYILALSLSARNESFTATSRSCRLQRLGFLLPVAAMIPASWVMLGLSWSACLAGSAAYLIWILLCLGPYRKPVPRHVSALLAGIPLVDAMLLLPIGISSANASLSLTATWSWLIAFGLGRLLQRLVPAT